MQTEFKIVVADERCYPYAEDICNEMAESALRRGTGIARRTPEYIRGKMAEGKAVIALDSNGVWAGFCYIESWQSGAYVANSGLIVNPEFRGRGVARAIKTRVFELSRSHYPGSKVFGLTTGLAVMKINSELGYKPVTYSELTSDEQFWSGCKSCVNFTILQQKEYKNCLCTAMLFDPAELPAEKDSKQPDMKRKFRLLERLRDKMQMFKLKSDKTHESIR